MKKLLCLSVVALSFAFQGVAVASATRESVGQNSGNDVVAAFCDQYSNSSMSSEEVAEQIKLFIAELDDPTLEQLSALLSISAEMENGKTISSACN